MGFLEFAADILPKLLTATGVTLEITAGSMTLGLIIGVALALGRVYGARPVRWLANGYIQFFRGTPLLVQLLIVYYGLSPYFQMAGVRLSPLAAAIAALGLNAVSLGRGGARSADPSGGGSGSRSGRGGSGGRGEEIEDFGGGRGRRNMQGAAGQHQERDELPHDGHSGGRHGYGCEG